MVVSSMMLAHQVAGKAARDALFLSQFNPAHLPLMVMVGASISIVGGLLNSRALQELTPARMVPWTFLASGVLHLAEWSLLAGPYRAWVVVAVYIHIVGLGAVALSSFWSLLNERFDPRTGKKYFGRIMGTGTAGGILGGIVAERFPSLWPTESILLFLAGVHVLCCGVSFLLVRRSRDFVPAERAANEHRVATAPWPLFRRSKYLCTLAALVVLGTTIAALLDIVFKTQAATLIGRGPNLLRFFALFYTAGQVLTLGLQLFVTRKWLENRGLAQGIGSLPAVVAAGGIGALIFPVFPVLVGVRWLEIILRGSIYRSGYELLYTPLRVEEKRAAKPVVDVVFDRMGDVLGGATSQIFLALGGAFAVKGILLATVMLSGVMLFITRLLRNLYVQVLEKGLLDRAVELDVASTNELTTKTVLLKTLSGRDQLVQSTGSHEKPEAESQQARTIVSDPLLQKLADLRSGNAERVRQTLAALDQFETHLVPQLIVLLAWDEITPDVLRVLRHSVGRISGQLVDSLLDKDIDFAIRRRIPRALAYSDDVRTVEGLMGALGDSRFEVRFQCARALDAILQRNPQHRPEPADVFAIIERELSVSRGVWESRRLLDSRQSADQFLFLDDVLRENAQLSWEHLFSLLALILPRAPLKVAFQALHTDDRMLRGLAMEYLDSVLPPSLRRMQSILETTVIVPHEKKVPQDVATRLMDLRDSVSLKLIAPKSQYGSD